MKTPHDDGLRRPSVGTCSPPSLSLCRRRMDGVLGRTLEALRCTTRYAKPGFRKLFVRPTRLSSLTLWQQQGTRTRLVSSSNRKMELQMKEKQMKAFQSGGGVVVHNPPSKIMSKLKHRRRCCAQLASRIPWRRIASNLWNAIWWIAKRVIVGIAVRFFEFLLTSGAC